MTPNCRELIEKQISFSTIYVVRVLTFHLVSIHKNINTVTQYNTQRRHTF